MKKAILSLAMLVMACCTFAQDAEHLIKQYKRLKGAEYENITKSMKKNAKKEQYVNPKNYDLSKRISKAEYLTVELSTDNREVLTKNIENIDNYKCLYQQKNNTENILNDNFTLFPNRQYYGIEENDTIKDGIIRADFHAGGKMKTVILHVTGELTLEEYMSIMGFEETKDINIVKD
jgi:hypothetical protein